MLRYLLLLLFSIAIALGLRWYVVETFRISVDGMKPTLLAGDWVLTLKYPFGIPCPWSETPFVLGRLPRYGEVVVYQNPKVPSEHLIKRVVGLPGDRVAVVQGHLVLNDKKAEFIRDGASECGIERHAQFEYPICLEQPLMEDMPPLKISKGEVFVLSDARKKNGIRKTGEPIYDKSVRASVLRIWFSKSWDRLFKEVN